MQKWSLTSPTTIIIKEHLISLQHWPGGVCGDTIPAIHPVNVFSPGHQALTTTSNSMQLFSQLCAFSLFGDERVYYPHFIDRARFESARVVGNELPITLEYQLVFNIMQSMLCYDDWKWI